MNRLFTLFLYLFLLSLGASAQSLYFPEKKWCQITNVSTANPAVVTTSTAPSTCNLTNGARIIINGVRGATIANIHLTTSGDTAGYSRIVGTISGNTFTLLDGASANINGAVDGSCSGAASTHAGNCAYTGGGRVALAYSVTRKTDPVLAFSTAIMTRLTTTSGSGAAQSSNPWYQKMIDLCTTRKGQTDSEGAGMQSWGITSALACALKFKIDGDTVALAKAKWDLTHPWQLAGHVACITNETWCGAGVSTQGDYPIHLFGEWYALTYTLIRDQLTGGERTDICNYILSDYPWFRGGGDYSASTRTMQTYKVSAPRGTPTSLGSVSVTFGSTSLTCTGCSFTTTVAAGDMISFPHGAQIDYPLTYRIASVTNDNALVLGSPARVGVSSVGYQVSAPWNDANNKGGLVAHQKHGVTGHNNDGSGPLGYPSTPYGSLYFSKYYGDSNSLAGTGDNVDGNAGAVWTLGAFELGTALCVDDPRGCILAARNYEEIVHMSVPFWQSLMTGFSTMGMVYHNQRGYDPHVVMGGYVANSWTGAPADFWGENTTLYSDYLKWYVGAKVRGNNNAPHWASKESSIKGISDTLEADRTYGVVAAIAKDPTSTIAKQALWVLRNDYIANGYNATAPWAAPAWYIHYDHTWTDTTLTDTTYLYTRTNRTQCEADYIKTLSGSCDWYPDEERRMVSWTGLNSTDTAIYATLQGLGIHDHASASGHTPGYLAIVRNNELLLGGDLHSNLSNTRERNGSVIPNAPTLNGGGDDTSTTGLGSSALRWYYEGANSGFSLPVLAAGNNAYVYVIQNLTSLYTNAANVTSMYQRTMHLKSGSQAYALVVNHLATSASQPVRSYRHLPLAQAFGDSSTFCGTPTSTSCLSLSSGVATNTKTDARLNVVPLAISSTAMRTATDSGSSSDWSYTGQVGQSGRFYMCPSSDAGVTCASATSHEWVEIYQAGGPTVTLPTRTKITSGSWRGAQIEDGTSPAVAMWHDPTLTPSQTSSSFTTTHSGNAQLLVAGFSTGFYNVSRNGTPVCSGVLTDSAGTVTCDSIASGNITVDPVPTPANGTLIRGGSIRGGTLR